MTYDDGEVDAFEYSGGSFGYLGSGNNSAGQGWGVDFDPIVGENQLIGFSANLGFAQDFGGSTVPQTADKDFDILFSGKKKRVENPVFGESSRDYM